MLKLTAEEGRKIKMDNIALKHHGIKGMKWGIRRTPAQLGRQSGSYKKAADRKEKTSRKAAVKNRRTLSDVDLEKKVKRLKLEKEFKELTYSDIAPGKKFVSDVMASAGKKALTVAAAGAVSYGVKVAMTKEFSIKEAASYIAANPNKKK